MVFLLVTLFNIGYMVNNVFLRFLSKQKKKKFQKAYESRFADFKARIEAEAASKKEFNLLKLQVKETIIKRYDRQIKML